MGQACSSQRPAQPGVHPPRRGWYLDACDETGLGRYSADAIKQALRNGTRLDGKKFAPPMSLLIAHISGMSEADIDALCAYMKTLPAARRKPPERELVASMRAQLGG